MSQYLTRIFVFHHVRLDDLSLLPGIFAVTGANGSGKSTLFRLLMGGDTNRKPIDISKSINLKSHGTIQMPPTDVVGNSQKFYWPLFTTLVDWVYHTEITRFFFPCGISSAHLLHNMWRMMWIATAPLERLEGSVGAMWSVWLSFFVREVNVVCRQVVTSNPLLLQQRAHVSLDIFWRTTTSYYNIWH